MPIHWGNLAGLVITQTGWTFPELDATPWPDLLDLLDYWAFGQEEPQEEELLSPEALRALVGRFQ